MNYDCFLTDQLNEDPHPPCLFLILSLNIKIKLLTNSNNKKKF